MNNSRKNCQRNGGPYVISLDRLHLTITLYFDPVGGPKLDGPNGSIKSYVGSTICRDCSNRARNLPITLARVIVATCTRCFHARHKREDLSGHLSERASGHASSRLSCRNLFGWHSPNFLSIREIEIITDR